MEQELRFTFEPETLATELDELEDEEVNIGADGERILKVRLDKWLWAARFFKTRPLARAAVENGKVFYNGQRSKPSREIEIEAVLQIRHGRYEKTVIVKGLSTRRRSTEEAFQLFEETEESKQIREQVSEFQQQPSSYNPYRPRREETVSTAPITYSNPDLQPPRERRAVRFLRRSFNRGDEQQPPSRRTDSPQQTPRYNDQQPRYNTSYNQTPRYGEQQPRYNEQNASRYNEQQPLSNDNLPPFSPFRNAPKPPQMPWEDEKFD